MATAFVSVGTTSFDELITEVNTLRFHQGLLRLGYKNLIVQFGNGTVFPRLPSGCNPTDADTLVLTTFRYKSNLNEEFDAASLIISHGGAGTCMQALTPPGKRKLIIVINESLMGNHQEELAYTLCENKHALVTTPPLLNDLIWTGVQRIGPSKSEVEKLSFSDIQSLLGPTVSPELAGFIGFKRGDPQHLLDYLLKKLC